MKPKSKEAVKLDQILKLLFSTSDKVLLNMLNSIFHENLSMENIKIRKSNNEFITYNLEDIQGDVFFDIEEDGREKNLKYHIEFQTKNDTSMVVRMFEYGFYKSKEDIDSDDLGISMRFPKQRVIFIEENGNIKDTLDAKIIFPDNKEVLYSVPVMKYWEYTDKMLIENKMYPLIPLQLFLLRKEISKASKNNDIVKIKGLSKEILDLTWKLGNKVSVLFNENNIGYLDYDKMLIAIRSLVEYFKENYIDDEELVKEAARMVKTLYDPEVEKRGIEKGIEKGMEKEKIAIAQNLLDILDDETIAEKTGLPLEKVKELRGYVH